jgi:hypothetical protein
MILTALVHQTQEVALVQAMVVVAVAVADAEDVEVIDK